GAALGQRGQIGLQAAGPKKVQAKLCVIHSHLTEGGVFIIRKMDFVVSFPSTACCNICTLSSSETVHMSTNLLPPDKEEVQSLLQQSRNVAM
uniref:Uncharacterized protein n=1 Tax=Melopsittacus undulatus TaxID=13146 RepID=A0A8V5H206_MELUD